MNTTSPIPVTRRAALALVAGAALVLTACAGLGGGPPEVVVAGATGQTGRLIVRQLLAGGFRVRAMVRDVGKAREQLGPDVEYVQADVRDPASLGAALAGADFLVSSIGARGKDGPERPEMIDYQGVVNLVDAAKAARIRQFVLVSSRGVTQADHPLNRMFGNVLAWKLKGEDHLRASGVPYTIVRPGGLLNEPPGKGDIVFEQGDRRFGGTTLAIPREDVAIVCVEALRQAGARNRTFEIHRGDGPPVTDWKAKFAGLQADPR